MSDYEMMNQRVAARKAARRKDALRRLAFLLGIVLAVLLLWMGLEWIGFISELFLVLLAFGTICVGCFHAGRIWNSYRR